MIAVPAALACCQDNSAMATGIVFALVWVSRKANKNSLHENITQNIDTAVKPGLNNGNNNLQKALNLVSPSIIPASSISKGRERINSLIIQTTKGRLNVVWAMISPMRVSSSSKRFMIKNMGITAAKGGSILIIRINRDILFAWLNLNLAKE